MIATPSPLDPSSCTHRGAKNKLCTARHEKTTRRKTKTSLRSTDVGSIPYPLGGPSRRTARPGLRPDASAGTQPECHPAEADNKSPSSGFPSPPRPPRLVLRTQSARALPAHLKEHLLPRSRAHGRHRRRLVHAAPEIIIHPRRNRRRERGRRSPDGRGHEAELDHVARRAAGRAGGAQRGGSESERGADVHTSSYALSFIIRASPHLLVPAGDRLCRGSATTFCRKYVFAPSGMDLRSYGTRNV